jgi:hypothetical protein
MERIFVYVILNSVSLLLIQALNILHKTWSAYNGIIYEPGFPYKKATEFRMLM